MHIGIILKAFEKYKYLGIAFFFLQSFRYVSNEQSCLKATGLYFILIFYSYLICCTFSISYSMLPLHLVYVLEFLHLFLFFFLLFFLKPLSSVCHAVLSHSVMSDSLWPHGLQLSRFLCPWGFSRHERAALPSSRVSS